MKRYSILLPALILTFAVAAGSPAFAANAANWPERPIQIIVPFGAGGDTDFNARAYTEYLTKELGQPVIVTNVSGSGGSVGARQVKDARPDGYTLLCYITTINVNEVVGTADFGFDSFKVAAIGAKGPGEIITVHKDSGITSLDGLFAYAKKHPGELDLAIDFGTLVHVNGLQMREAGADINFVDAGGAAERVAALAGRHIDILMAPYGTLKDYLKTGEFVALGHINNEPSPGLSGIKSAREQGYEIVVEKLYWFGFPKDTPQGIIDKFAAAVKKTSADPAYQKAVFTAYAQSPFYADGQQAVDLMQRNREMIQKYSDLLKAKKQ